jgi:hypothetical protein
MADIEPLHGQESATRASRKLDKSSRRAEDALLSISQGKWRIFPRWRCRGIPETSDLLQHRRREPEVVIGLFSDRKPHIFYDFGSLAVRVVVSELGHNREMFNKGWI